MNDKTFVVMISSTILDLHEHRQYVKDACITAKMMPRMMEHLPASDNSGLAESLRLVDEADIYLAILGYRYGHVPKGKTKSITHYEYERAKKRGIPREIFIMHEDHPLRAGDVEKGKGSERLEQFKSKLKDIHSVNLFKSASELKTQVINTLTSLKERNAATIPPTHAPEAEPRSVISAELTAIYGPEVLRRVGCPCLLLKLKCLSAHPAKIAGAKLRVHGPHILAALQKGFSTDFGFNPSEVQVVDEPSFSMKFLPTTRPDTPHGFIIGQDYFRKFLLPVPNGMVLPFAEAPPSDVYLEVDFLDDHSEKVLEGVEVQKDIPLLTRMCLDQKYNLNPSIVISMGVHVGASQEPDGPNPGFLNDQPFQLPPHPRRDISIDPDSDKIRLRAKILRAGGEWDFVSEDWLVGIVREHADREVRRDAIVSLRRLATARVRELFFELLSTESNEITRELIIRSFALVGVSEDITTMERMAESEASRFCREAARVALQILQLRFGNPKPVE